MTTKQLQQQLAAHKYYPVYLLFGEEEYFINQYVELIAESALSSGDPSFNLDTFYGSEAQAADVAGAANAFPVMSDRRVVILKEADKLANTDPLPGYIQSPSPDTVLVLVAGDIPKDKRKAKVKKFNFFAHLEAQGGTLTPVIEFKKMNEAQMGEWIIEESRKLGKTIRPEAAAAVIGLKGLSAREIAGELEKITTALSDKEEIETGDVLEYLGASKKYNIFELSAKVLERNTPAAQEIALNIIATESALGITAFLFREFSILWRIAHYQLHGKPTDEDARNVGLVWQWQYSDKAKYVRNFSENGRYERCFEALLDADVELKSRPTDERTVIARLIHQLTA